MSVVCALLPAPRDKQRVPLSHANCEHTEYSSPVEVLLARLKTRHHPTLRPEKALTMSDQLIEKLSDDATWQVFRENQIGRIAAAREGAPDIYPVSYLVHNWKIFLRTGGDSRLRRETEGKLVAFEAATQTPETFSSAVCLGTLDVVDDDAEIEELEQLLIVNFSREENCVWMMLTPRELRGRKLRLLAPPNDR